MASSTNPIDKIEDYLGLLQDKIRDYRPLFDCYVYTILQDLVEQLNVDDLHINTTKGVVYDITQNKCIIIHNYPSIYMVGGSAYNAYDMYFSTPKHQQLNVLLYPTDPVFNDNKLATISPTIDYDITISLSQLNDTNVNKLCTLIISKLNEHFDKIEKTRQDFYFQTFTQYDPILNTRHIVIPTHCEHFNSLSNQSTLIHDSFLPPDIKQPIFEIAIRKTKLNDTEYKYVNIIVNINIYNKKTGKTSVEHLIEFNLTNQKYIEIPVEKIIILKNRIISNINYIVPDIDSLLYMSFIAIINRSNKLSNYRKCRQDVKRIKYLLNSIFSSQTNKMLLHYINFTRERKYIDVLDTIITQLNLDYCVDHAYDETKLKEKFKIYQDPSKQAKDRIQIKKYLEEMYKKM